MAGKAPAAAAGGETKVEKVETPAAGGETKVGEGAGAGETKTGEGTGTETGKGAEGEGAGNGKETKTGEGAGGEGTKVEEQGAPDKYELTLPEDGILDERDRSTIEAYAKAQKLSNEDAQALLEEHAGQLRTQSAAWLAETTKDKTYGGDKLAETQKLARAAIAKVRPESHPRAKAFNALLNKGGVFNHIEIVSFLADLGRMMGEDGGVAGASNKGGKKSLEEKIYNHPTSQVQGTDD